MIVTCKRSPCTFFVYTLQRIILKTVVILLSVGTFSCKHAELFEEVSASHTNIHFTNILEKHKAFGILYYLYYYNGGGVATGDVNGDGLPDIYFAASRKVSDKLYFN